MKNSDEREIVGRHFHTIRDGRIEYQGRITEKLADGRFRALRYSFVDGSPTTSHVVDEDEVRSWTLYATDADMRRAWEAERGITNA